MSWTYDSNYALQRDVIRDLLGDTDSTDPLVTDEQISKYTVGGVMAQANSYLAAAMVASEIANKFTRLARSLSAGGTSVQYGDRSAEFKALAKELRLRSTRAGSGAVYAGGISQSNKDVQTDNADNVIPAFTRAGGGPFNDPLRPDWSET